MFGRNSIKRGVRLGHGNLGQRERRRRGKRNKSKLVGKKEDGERLGG